MTLTKFLGLSWAAASAGPEALTELEEERRDAEGVRLSALSLYSTDKDILQKDKDNQ